MASSSSWVRSAKRDLRGRYWRNRPLVFSLVPRCHGLRGSQKNTGTPLATVNCECAAISLPWSQVNERRSCAGRGDRRGERVGDHISGVTGRQSDEHHEATGSLDQGRDGADALAEDEIAFPMSRNGTVVGFCGSFADVDQVADLPLTVANVLWVCGRPTAGTSRAEIAGQLFAQRAAGLHEQRLIDRLVRHAHLRIVGELAHQPTRDLLRRPPQLELRFHDRSQPRTHHQLRRPRPTRPTQRGPVSSTRPIRTPTPVPRDLTQHRRR